MATPYDNIKQSLLKMIEPTKNEQVQNNIENFTLMPPPMPLSELNIKFKNDPMIPSIVKQYNLIPSEIYSVVDNFDIPGSNLNQADKDLRLKYLRLLIKAINDNFSLGVKIINESPAIPNNDFKRYITENVLPTKNLIIRIINLMIAEIIPQPQPACPTCPAPPPCPVCPAPPPPCQDTKPFIGGIIGLVVLVIIMSIMYAMKSCPACPEV